MSLISVKINLSEKLKDFELLISAENDFCQPSESPISAKKNLSIKHFESLILAENDFCQ